MIQTTITEGEETSWCEGIGEVELVNLIDAGIEDGSLASAFDTGDILTELFEAPKQDGLLDCKPMHSLDWEPMHSLDWKPMHSLDWKTVMEDVRDAVQSPVMNFASQTSKPPLDDARLCRSSENHHIDSGSPHMGLAKSTEHSKQPQSDMEISPHHGSRAKNSPRRLAIRRSRTKTRTNLFRPVQAPTAVTVSNVLTPASRGSLSLGPTESKTYPSPTPVSPHFQERYLALQHCSKLSQSTRSNVVALFQRHEPDSAVPNALSNGSNSVWQPLMQASALCASTETVTCSPWRLDAKAAALAAVAAAKKAARRHEPIKCPRETRAALLRLERRMMLQSQPPTSGTPMHRAVNGKRKAT